MKYLVKFDYGYVSRVSSRMFEWTDKDEKPVALTQQQKDEAVKNMKHYNFNYEVITVAE